MRSTRVKVTRPLRLRRAVHSRQSKQLRRTRPGSDQTLFKFIGWFLLVSLCWTSAAAKPLRHYVFFGQERDKIKQASSFLEMKIFEGAQVRYTWRQLEPKNDEYDFSAIREDLEFLESKGKKLFIQLQDVSFSERWNPVPRYLLEDPRYNGGADKQYDYKAGDEEHATVTGWMSRRWDPAVQDRFHKLLAALGKEFDGRIEGINFAESSVTVGITGRLFPKGFTFEIYRDGIITNMRALKRAFPKSVRLQYANFMPGEWQPNDDKGYLRAVYKAARELGVGVGGPDLLPYKPGQMNNSYHLIRDAAGIVPVGVAVQDGNYAHVNPQTRKQVTLAEIVAFATDYLKADYIFWCTEEPYYSEQLIPFLRSASQVKPIKPGASSGEVSELSAVETNDFGKWTSQGKHQSLHTSQVGKGG